MKTIKTKLVFAAVLGVSCLYCMGVSEGPDCNGTTTQKCQLPSNQCGVTWAPAGGPVYENACIAYGTGAGSINVCTGGNDNDGLCGQNGTVTCSYSVTITSSTGDVVYTGNNSSNANTYECFR